MALLIHIDVQDFMSETGVRPDKSLSSVPVGGTISGTLEKPSALAKVGFQGNFRKGDSARISRTGADGFNISFPGRSADRLFVGVKNLKP